MPIEPQSITSCKCHIDMNIVETEYPTYGFRLHTDRELAQLQIDGHYAGPPEAFNGAMETLVMALAKVLPNVTMEVPQRKTA